MDASAATGDAKSSAPIWKHGPSGELGIGPLKWQRWRQLMLVLCVPTILFFIFVLHSWAVFIIFCGSIIAANRLAKLEGTPSLVEAATMHWGLMFAAAAGGLLALELLQEQVGGTVFGLAYGFGFVGFIYLVGIRYGAQRLLEWEPQASKIPLPEVSLGDLKAMREEIEWGRVSLDTLPVFDEKKPELLKAWEDRDPPRIAHILQEGNVQTQESWSRVNTMFNRAQTYIDRSRSKLNRLLIEAEQRLKPFNINYDAIPIEPSKQGHLEMSAAIPKNLTAKRINQQNTAFIQGGARSVAQGAFGQLPPLAAVAAVGIAVAAHFIYKSRNLRKLKDVEGQLVINAKAVRGDCAMVNSVFTTRLLPQFDAMMDVTSRLEQGLAELQAGSIDTDDKTQRDKALQMAFALVQGKKLVATAGGN